MESSESLSCPERSSSYGENNRVQVWSVRFSRNRSSHHCKDAYTCREGQAEGRAAMLAAPIRPAVNEHQGQVCCCSESSECCLAEGHGESHGCIESCLAHVVVIASSRPCRFCDVCTRVGVARHTPGIEQQETVGSAHQTQHPDTGSAF